MTKWALFMEQARSSAHLAEFHRLECISAIIRGDVFEAGINAKWSCHLRRDAMLWVYNAQEAVRIEGSDYAEITAERITTGSIAR